VHGKAALAKAREIDQLRQSGRAPSRFAGIPFSAKDLFDIAGQVTTAGSVVLRKQAPAKADALAIARLKAAGMINLGRTNMTEFAYSGVGLNPHYGTPTSVWDRQTGRIPGGSSSGAAVSVADGTCALGIGTDTGGSCRVPAAFNGLAGYKSSLGRVPVKGVYPLAVSFDTVGPMAQTVQCCASADALMSGVWDGVVEERSLSRLRLGVPQSLVLDDLDDETAVAFGKALTRLACSGAEIVDVSFDELAQLPAINASGGIAALEAYAVHKDLLESHGELFDQRVRKRVLAAKNINADESKFLHAKREEMLLLSDRLMAKVNVFVFPTTPKVASAVSELDKDDDYGRINLLALRNTFVGNFLNKCAISIPVHEPGSAPVGLMLMAPLGADEMLFSVAAAVEKIVSSKLS